MTFKDAEEEIKRLDPSLNTEDDAFKAASLMLFGSLERKFTISVLEHLSGYEKKIVSKTVRQLKNEGIWRQSSVDGIPNQWVVYHSGWFDEESGGVAFWLDVGRILGYITTKEKAAIKSARL